MTMGLLGRLLGRAGDVRVLKEALERAERIARERGDEVIGAHHLMLAAIDLSDGSARRAFARLGADADAFEVAVGKAHDAALRGLGLSPSEGAPAVHEGRVFMKSDATCEAAMRATYELHGDEPLTGAHVVAGVCAVEHGVAARALTAMDLDRRKLAAAALAEAGVGDP